MYIFVCIPIREGEVDHLSGNSGAGAFHRIKSNPNGVNPEKAGNTRIAIVATRGRSNQNRKEEQKSH